MHAYDVTFNKERRRKHCQTERAEKRNNTLYTSGIHQDQIVQSGITKHYLPSIARTESDDEQPLPGTYLKIQGLSLKAYRLTGTDDYVPGPQEPYSVSSEDRFPFPLHR